MYICDLGYKPNNMTITSHSIEHTFIDIFFEDTCVQVIRLWYIVILFRLWVIYDGDDVL
jgi:hypothetical protein